MEIKTEINLFGIKIMVSYQPEDKENAIWNLNLRANIGEIKKSFNNPKLIDSFIIEIKESLSHDINIESLTINLQILWRGKNDKIINITKEDYIKNEINKEIDSAIDDNHFRIVTAKVEMAEMKLIDNINIENIEVISSNFGKTINKDEKKEIIEMLGFLKENSNPSDITTNTKAIIEQNKYLQNLVLENVLKTTREEVIDDEKLKKSLQERIIDKWKSLDSEKKEKFKLFPLSETDESKRKTKPFINESDLEGASFDTLTFLSFQIYEASKIK